MPSHLGLYTEFRKLSEYNTLTSGQQEFVRLFFEGHNVLLSGAAGTGKSYVVQLLFSFLQARKVSVGKTALTGVAAFNIGGQTLHSFAGLGLAEEDINTLVRLVGAKKKAVARITTCQVLIIDEISMCKADLFDKLDMVLKYFRFNNKPFGGVQLLLVGDWLQLAPVWKGDEAQDFCFNSRAWQEASIHTVELTEIMRQVHDPRFAEALNRIRVGDTSGLDLIRTRVNAQFESSEIEPVRIFCKNVDVDRLNAEKLAALPGAPKAYKALDDGQPFHTEQFNRNCPAPQTLALKVGAQVMLLANLDTQGGLINGSLGVVKGFSPQGVVVQFDGGPFTVGIHEWQITEQEAKKGGGYTYKVVARRTQLPLRLAYAVTTHKVQGMTLDRAIVDMTEAFSTGMVYVALSRVRNLESLSVVDFHNSRVKVSQACLDFYRKLPSRPASAVAAVQA